MYYCKNQFSTPQAIRLSESKAYRKWTPFQILAIQLYQKRLLMPLNTFQGAVTLILGSEFVKRPMHELQTVFEKENGIEFREQGFSFVSKEINQNMREEFIKKSLPQMLVAV